MRDKSIREDRNAAARAGAGGTDRQLGLTGQGTGNPGGTTRNEFEPHPATPGVTVIGLDDTDSRERGMCTTYVATRLAERIIGRGGTVERRLLVRLNPAIERKTRGNAALAIHTDLDPESAWAVASRTVEEFAVADTGTSPGVVTADCAPDAIPSPVARFARTALRRVHSLEDALDLLDSLGWKHGPMDASDGHPGRTGHGRIGALAAVGAWAAFDEWTIEHLAYRDLDRCGTPRLVEDESVFDAAEDQYPTTWDTVDRSEAEAVCVPSAPGPVLYGIRGDLVEACRAVSDAIHSEPPAYESTFLTNQGTDAHLRSGKIGDLVEGRGYRVDGIVTTPPETRAGGHVFFDITHPSDVRNPGAPSNREAPGRTVACVAFEPTKRFRDDVRNLRPGDELTVAGEFTDGTIKLEKFAVRDLVQTQPTPPRCPRCDRSMESVGRNQGYRCRDCNTDAPGKVAVPITRNLEQGWYEVPPCARRHIAKPLIRGGFDAPVHPER